MALFKFTDAILRDKPIDMYNHGKMKRDFTYVDDIVSGVLAALDRDYPCEIFNLGNHRPVELPDFIGHIEKRLGKKAKRNLLPMQPGDVPASCADIAHSKKMLGYEPRTPVEEGIGKFIDWYKSYYKL
jgi:UDP-glucuronate 4-epimerase